MIVDASVAFKWLVREVMSSKAIDLLVRDDLSAPSIVDFEVAQGLTREARRRVLSAETTGVLWGELKRAHIRRVDWRLSADSAVGLSLALRATFADCLYLALAVETNDIMVTADERFVRAVRSAPGLGGRVVSLADL